ncbi:MAG: hypothetical protein RL638_945 [Bacteroidota bacterium]
MIHTMRWFGPNDPVSLMDIRQAGCTGVVTALHQIPVGEIWPVEAIQERIAIIEAGNQHWSPLHWSVVESLPVHEGIKKALPSRDGLIENYQTSLRNLAACGIKTVCYNFMPVLDWSRTKLNFEMPDGAKALRFVWTDFAVFDLHILQRPGAAADYTPAVQAAAAERFASMTVEEKEELKNTALLGLPGSEEAFHLENFQSLLDEYRDISAEQLRENLHYFVRLIAPLAQELGINLCIHPDDPPFPLLGLPRVVSTEADLAALMAASPERANGITFCTGSLGVRADNDLPKMLRRFADRIHFLHLRATFREQNEPLIFYEAPHLTGDVDMFEVVKAVVEEEKRRGGEGIPMRPDHGHQMLDDLKKKTYPGYSAIGRLRGLAEFRGLELAIRSFLAMFLVVCSFAMKADDGYRLWLKFDKVASAARYAPFAQSLSSEFPSTPILETAKKELAQGLKGLTGVSPRSIAANGSIQFLKDATIPEEGFEIQVDKKVQVKVEGLSVVGRKYIRIKARSDRGILYGVFELLRTIQQEKALDNITSSPKVKFRMLNHWDNVMGTIERGYAGQSLWKWYELPETVDSRYTEYARANASIGINAVAINNVNASARFLTPEYLAKVKALADVFRPYGIKLFLSVNFASPKILGRLKTSDPLDPEVRAWWQAKTKEVYHYIPDFGGFLVKANSEGEPGPQEFGRTHADGANMLAEAVKPFNGIVIWRAFVYAPNPKGDRFKEAYNDFKPLDGTFAKNVIVQVKNGPIDFQPREPFHPLFGAMPKTPLALEFQITQEYTGFSTNVFYQSILFKECLDSDTYQNGKGSTVAKVIDGSLGNAHITMMAGVANTGSDRNWTGHLLSQANWYAFGRLAWDHTLSSEKIAEEWVKQTLTRDAEASQTIENILLKSRDVYVNFTTPLGLHHVMGQSIHWGPEPWLERSQRPDWTSIYYHRADSLGLGFDRKATGSNALSLYHPEVAKQWLDPTKTDLNYLLWFHHVGWQEKLSSGRSLWDEFCYRYDTGLKEVEALQKDWESAKGKVDPEIFADVRGRLAAQQRESVLWRDANVLYFQTYSKLPINYGKPTRTLAELKEIVRIYQLK